MASRVYIRAWKKEDGTEIADREIVYVRSEKALYIGTGNNRAVKLCNAELDTDTFATKTYVDDRLIARDELIDDIINRLNAAGI